MVQIKHDAGVAMLIMEHKIREALEICHRVHSIKAGKVSFAGSAEAVRGDRQKLKEMFF